MLVRVAVIVAAAVAAAGAAGAPPGTHQNGRIAVAALGKLIELNPDGSGIWPARQGQTDAADSWSPDGTRLAIQSGDDIWLVDPDGGNRTRLTFSPGFDEYATFSPDATKIAFDREGVTGHRVMVMNADGTGAHSISESFPDASQPTWSPDGSQIAFQAHGDIWITSANGIGARLLVGGGVENLWPAWSPDGSTILFASDRNGNFDIYAARVIDGVLTQLTTHPADDRWPVWSPDGAKILFTSTRSGNGTGDLFTMNADGSAQTQITFTGGFFTRGAWQPLGSPPSGCTIWGTPADDLLVGSPRVDDICGLGGNDRILGDEGNDVLYGGPGADSIDGGPGADLIDAGPGNDVVDARDRDPDVINAGTGGDSVLLDRGLDRVRNAEVARDPEPANLARGRPVRTSLALPTDPAAFAVDGHRTAFWNSSYAPQWIEIDLGAPQTVSRIALIVAQTQPGATDHVVLGRAHSFDRWRGLAELNGETHDSELLQATPTRPWRNVRYVRIETRKSPSWVAWKEVAVFAAR